MSPFWQSIEMSYVPLAVLPPTFHFQVTSPDELAVFGSRPLAVDGPEL